MRVSERLSPVISARRQWDCPLGRGAERIANHQSLFELRRGARHVPASSGAFPLDCRWQKRLLRANPLFVLTLLSGVLADPMEPRDNMAQNLCIADNLLSVQELRNRNGGIFQCR